MNNLGRILMNNLGWILSGVLLISQIFSYFKVPDMILKKFESKLSKESQDIQLEFTKSLEIQKEKFEKQEKLASTRMNFYPQVYENMYVAYSFIVRNDFNNMNKGIVNFKNEVIKHHLLISEETYVKLMDVKDAFLDLNNFKKRVYSSSPDKLGDPDKINKEENTLIKKCDELMDEVQEYMRNDLLI